MHAVSLWLAFLQPTPAPANPPAASSPVHAELQPLIGGSKWLPIHAVITSQDTAFDFVPLRPKDASTLATLVTGGVVPGSIRCRPAPLINGRPARLRAARRVLLGYTSKSRETLVAFASAQPAELQLLRSDCWTFASAVASFALAEEA